LKVKFDGKSHPTDQEICDELKAIMERPFRSEQRMDALELRLGLMERIQPAENFADVRHDVSSIHEQLATMSLTPKTLEDRTP
jgi:hypothetical protein